MVHARSITIGFALTMTIFVSVGTASFFVLGLLPESPEATWLRWFLVALMTLTFLMSIGLFVAVRHLIGGLHKETDRAKEALAAVRESEERYRSLVDLCPDAVWIHRNYRLTYINRAGCELMGIADAGAALDQSPLDFLHPDSHALVRERFGAMLEAGGSFPFIEVKIIRKDRTRRHVEMAATRISDQGVPAMLVMLRDVTERKRVADALAVKEQRMRLALEAGGMGTWDWNLATNRIVWSEDYALVYGLEPEVFEDGYEPFLRYTHPDDLERVVYQLVEARLHFQPFQCEYRIENGEEIRWIAVHGRVEGDGEVASRMIGLVMDVTERKLSDERRRTLLEQLHALTAHLQQVREEERTRIAREIHDELGQALTGIKMEISWCKNRLSRHDENQAREFMLGKTDVMSQLIDDTIRTVRRIASELRPGVLDELGLEAAIDWLARDFQNRSGIECEVRTEEVRLDRDRSTAMFRVCQEALTNVARHAGATKVSIRLERDEEELVLRVRDNGRGIRPREKGQSNSLGLLGMRERVSLAGGELSIEGSPGQGTSVVMRLRAPSEVGSDQ